MEKTTVASQAWICSNNRGQCHVLCRRCVDDDGRTRKRCKIEGHTKHTVVYVGPMMGEILAQKKQPHEPFFPGNIAYVPMDTVWTVFRESVMARDDFSIQIDKKARAFSSVSKFFDSLGALSIDVPAGKEYRCKSDVQETVVLYDREQCFAAKFTFCFSSNKKISRFSVVPYVWLPKTDAIHEFVIKVTPDYEFVWLIAPLRYRPELTFPFKDTPQPPRGIFEHSLVFSLEPFKK